MYAKGNGNLLRDVNGKVLFGTIFLCSFILFGYLLELIRGVVSTGYAIGSMGSVVVILVLLVTLYLRNKERKDFKYVAVLSFYTLYVFILYKSTTPTAYTLIFPLMILFILYYDMTLMKVICALGIVINLLKIGYAMFIVDPSPMINFNIYITQMMSVILFFITINQTTALSMKFNKLRLLEVEEEQEKAKNMTNTLKGTVETLANNSKDILQSIEAFTASVEEISSSVHTIDEQMEKTLLTIDDQLALAEQSNEYIEVTEVNSQTVMDKVSHSEDNVKAGQTALDDLTNNMEKVAEINQLTHDTIMGLQEKVKDIEVDIRSIEDISEKTRLLALNASIESARVGEYGRGFAVIAEEIKDLAEKTQQLTTNINDGVQELTNKTSNSVDIFGELNHHLDEQKGLLGTNDVTFRTIASTTSEVSNSTQKANASIQQVTANLNAIKEQAVLISSFARNVKESIEVTNFSFNESLMQLERIQDNAMELSSLANDSKINV